MAAAHVAVVGGEDDHGVVPGAGRLQGAEDGAEAGVGQLVEVDVVVEVAEPAPRVGGVDVAPETVLLVPAPLAVGLGLGVQVVGEVGRQVLDHLGVGLRVDGQCVVVLPRRRLEDGPDGGDVLRVGLAVAGLVDRVPHHVMGVHESHGEEPGAPAGRRGAGVAPEPVGGVGGDEGVEVHAGAGPAHEVAVVAVPVGEAVGLHVGLGGVGEVPLADVGRPVAGAGEQRSEGRRRGGQLGVLGHDHVVRDTVALQVAAGEQAGPAGGARRRVGEVVGELESLGSQTVAPGQSHPGGQP